MMLIVFASSTVAQKKSAKTAAPAAPKKEITDADVPRKSVDELILAIANKKPVIIIDVRHKGDYGSKIKGALQIPLDEIEARMKEIPRNKEIITYCSWTAEHTSAGAAVKLLANGYKKVSALKGGWNAWMEAGGLTEASQ